MTDETKVKQVDEQPASRIIEGADIITSTAAAVKASGLNTDAVHVENDKPQPTIPELQVKIGELDYTALCNHQSAVAAHQRVTQLLDDLCGFAFDLEAMQKERDLERAKHERATATIKEKVEAVKLLMRSNSDLGDENDKLKTENAAMLKTIDEQAAELATVKAENVTLRQKHVRPSLAGKIGVYHVLAENVTIDGTHGRIVFQANQQEGVRVNAESPLVSAVPPLSPPAAAVALPANYTILGLHSNRDYEDIRRDPTVPDEDKVNAFNRNQWHAYSNTFAWIMGVNPND